MHVGAIAFLCIRHRLQYHVTVHYISQATQTVQNTISNRSFASFAKQLTPSNTNVNQRIKVRTWTETGQQFKDILSMVTSGYATWFTAGGAIRIAHYDVITRKL